MITELLRLLFDFGIVVLIWLVQLVIYPGLCHYPEESLSTWHQKYTLRVSYVVMPLLIGQLVLAGIQAGSAQTVYTISSLFLIIILWLSTFVRFVPLHNKIGSGEPCNGIPQQLVKRNWLRTLLWTGLFIWTFVRFLIKINSAV